MKRFIIGVILCAMVATTFAACSDKNPSDSSPTDTASSATVEEVIKNTPEQNGSTESPNATSGDKTTAPSTDQTGSTDKPSGSETAAAETDKTTAKPTSGTPDKTASAVTGTQTPSAGKTPSAGTAASTPGKTTSAPTPTPTPTPEQYGPLSADYVKFSDLAASGIFTNPNQCSYTVTKDSSEGYIVKLSTTGSSNDPYITFNYKTFLTKYKLSPVSANTYKYVLLKVKCENCSNGTFELFYTTSSSTAITGANRVQTAFDNADSGWQYIIFDLSNSANWKNNVTSFRFDFMTSASAKNENMYISEVRFTKTFDEAKKIANYDTGSTGAALTAEQQKRAEELLKISDAAPSVSNTKLTAAKEDSSINLWFDHTYTKTPAETTKSTGLYTYQMRLAKNEIEACQFILASSSAKNGLTASLTEFTDSKGNKLKAEIFYGYYFDDVQGKSIADPIPPLTGSFNLTANKSKLFLIKVYSTASTVAGQYSATLSIKDSAGNEVKKAKVYAYVWNFTLPEASSCKTLADIDWWGIYACHGQKDPKFYAGDDSLTYAKYYDYLLENRICGYTLPYDTDGTFSDSRIIKYLDNPRVVAFNPIGWKTELTTSNATSAYNYLKKKPEWLKKAYFYTVDEPSNQTQLDKVIESGKILKSNFPNYKLIVPMHLNTALKTDGSVDYFQYIKEYVNTWCPHTFFFTSFNEYRCNPLLTYRASAKIESVLGTFGGAYGKKNRPAETRYGGM